MSTLEALGHLGEFVGAMGVVISLIYLAGQMRQNTTSVRAASFNSMVQNSLRLLEHAFRDSEFAEFVYRAQSRPESLSPEDEVRWDSYMTACYRHFGNLIYQFRVGALDRQMWEAYERTLKDHLRIRAWADWYLAHEHLFSSALADSVHQKLREIKAEPTVRPTLSGEAPRGLEGVGTPG